MNRLVLCVTLSCFVIGMPNLADADWDNVEAILQRKGERTGRSLSFSFPRIDRRAGTGNAREMCPSSMVSKVTFTRTGRNVADLEGVIVALRREAAAVEKKLRAEGLVVTKVLDSRNMKAVHIHFMGRGIPENLVWSFTPALSATDTPMGPPLFGPENTCRKADK